MKRRFFIQALPFLSVSAKPLAVFASPGINSVNSNELIKLLDLLIPADDSPSASQLNIHQDLLNNHKYLKLTKKSLNSINSMSRVLHNKTFEQLTTEQSNQTIQVLFDDASKGPLFSYFYQQCLELYYAKPESWQQSPITTPPQPLGFNI